MTQLKLYERVLKLKNILEEMDATGCKSPSPKDLKMAYYHLGNVEHILKGDRRQA